MIFYKVKLWKVDNWSLSDELHCLNKKSLHCVHLQIRRCNVQLYRRASWMDFARSHSLERKSCVILAISLLQRSNETTFMAIISVQVMSTALKSFVGRVVSSYRGC